VGRNCIIVSDGVCVSVLYHTCEFYLGFGMNYEFFVLSDFDRGRAGVI